MSGANGIPAKCGMQFILKHQLCRAAPDVDTMMVDVTRELAHRQVTKKGTKSNLLGGAGEFPTILLAV